MWVYEMCPYGKSDAFHLERESEALHSKAEKLLGEVVYSLTMYLQDRKSCGSIVSIW